MKQVDKTANEVKSPDGGGVGTTRLRHVKVFKQKIKHLLFEHKAGVDHLHTENTTALKIAAEQHRVAELQLRRDKASLKERMHNEQIEHEELVKKIKKVSITEMARGTFSLTDPIHTIEK